MLAGCLDTPAGSPFWPRLTLSWVGGVGCGEEQLAPLLPNGAQLHHVVSLSLWVSPMGWIISEQLWCRRLWRSHGCTGQGHPVAPKGASSLQHTSPSTGPHAPSSGKNWLQGQVATAEPR